MIAFWQESYNLDSVLKSKDITLPTKVHIVRVFPVVICGCESWTRKKPGCWTVVLEKTLESPLESRETKAVNLEGNQPCMLFRRTDDEAEAPVLWPPNVNSWFIGKDPDAGKDWRQKEKRATEDESVGWHHQLNGHELGQTQGGWGTGKPRVLQAMGWWRVRHDSATE